MKENTYPMDQLVALLDDEGDDLMFMMDLKNPEMVAKVEALKPIVAEAFNKFAKEVSLAADRFPSNTGVKVKAILVTT